MWTMWLTRILEAHDEADYAALRARRPSLADDEATCESARMPDGAPLAETRAIPECVAAE